MRLCPFIAPIRWPQWPRLLAAWGRREYKLQVADSHGAALDNAQACFTEDGDDLGEADVTVAVKGGNNASPLWWGCFEIDGQDATSGVHWKSRSARSKACVSRRDGGLPGGPPV